MIKTLFLSLFVTLSSLLTFSQDSLIGKEVPDYTFSDVLNSDQKDIQLSDLKGTPIVLDFWATWCTPCISGMKKLEEYQEKYGNEIKIIAVSLDNRLRLQNYVESVKPKITIVADTIHQTIFPYKVIPHTILIDHEGIVRAVLNGKTVEEEMLLKLMNDQPIEVVKKEEEQQSKTNKTPKIIDAVSTSDYTYTLSQGEKGKGSRFLVKDRNRIPYAMEITNSIPWWLYVRAYDLSSPLRLYVDGFDEDELAFERYSLSIEVAPNSEKDIYTIGQEVLSQHLPFKAEYTILKTDSLFALEVLDSAKLPPVSTLEKRSYQMYGPVFMGDRIRLKTLLGYLEEQTMTPILDKTGLTDFYDIHLDWQFEAPETIHRELAKYGLKLEKIYQEVEVEYLRITKPT